MPLGVVTATPSTSRSHPDATACTETCVLSPCSAHVRCMGKGRKSRCTPLRPDVIAMLKAWLSRHPGASADPLFPSVRGGRPLSADGVQRLVARQDRKSGV